MIECIALANSVCLRAQSETSWLARGRERQGEKGHRPLALLQSGSSFRSVLRDSVQLSSTIWPPSGADEEANKKLPPNDDL